MSSRKTLPPIKPNGLSKYGYTNIKNMSANDRRIALKNAVESEGYAPVLKRMNLIANYVKNTNKSFYNRLQEDMGWIRKNLKAKYSLTANPKRTKRGNFKLVGSRYVDGYTRNIWRENLNGRLGEKFYRIRKNNSFQKIYL